MCSDPPCGPPVESQACVGVTAVCVVLPVQRPLLKHQQKRKHSFNDHIQTTDCSLTSLGLLNVIMEAIHDI